MNKMKLSRNLHKHTDSKAGSSSSGSDCIRHHPFFKRQASELKLAAEVGSCSDGAAISTMDMEQEVSTRRRQLARGSPIHLRAEMYASRITLVGSIRVTTLSVSLHDVERR